MSKKSLLQSLLSNHSSNNRSASLFQKANLGTNEITLQRSSSSEYNKKHNVFIADSNNANRLMPLIRMSHLINLKLKQIHYFCFCRIQKYKKSQKSGQKDNLSVEKTQCLSISLKCKQSEQMEKGFLNLITTYSSIKNKRQLNQNESMLLFSFSKIKSWNKLMLSCEKLTNACVLIKNNKTRIVFDRMKQIEKKFIKIHILIANLNDILSKYTLINQKLMFNKLKQQNQHRIKIFTLDKNQMISNNTSSYISKNQISIDYYKPMSKKQEDIEKTNLISKFPLKKIIITKQKKNLISIAQPINLYSKSFSSLKSNLSSISEDIPFCHIPERKDMHMEKMNKISHLHSEEMTGEMIDFNSNNLIFQTLNFERIEPVIFYENCFTEKKVISNVEPQEMCFTTQRNKKLSQKQKYNAKSISHQKTDEEFYRKQSSSPLVQIDQILKQIQKIKAFNSKELTQKSSRKYLKIKVAQNINDGKTLNNSAKKMSNHTPIKYNKTNTDFMSYKSQEKQNVQFRLMTEKQNCRNIKTNIKQEEQRILNKNCKINRNKAKSQKQQLFTAKKMKMEIQNIINRRNKMLTPYLKNQFIKQLK